jgi:hypothetical protein
VDDRLCAVLREIRTHILSQIASGELTEDSNFGPVFDALESLEKLELTMAIEELGSGATVEIRTVGDLFRFLKMMDSQRRR